MTRHLQNNFQTTIVCFYKQKNRGRALFYHATAILFFMWRNAMAMIAWIARVLSLHHLTILDMMTAQ